MMTALLLASALGALQEGPQEIIVHASGLN
jgi:hypothetical protein